MEGTVRAWGGSLALRIGADEARRLGLKPGSRIRWEIVEDLQEVDLGAPPFFDDDPDASTRHDELLYGA